MLKRFETTQTQRSSLISTRRAAIFDLDGTVIDCSSERMFVHRLWKAGLVTGSDFVRWAATAVRMLPGGAATALQGNRSYLRGKGTETIEAFAQRVVEERLKPRIAPLALEQAEEHRRRGERVILLSGSLRILVEPLAAILGAEVCEASDLESRGGFLTGRLAGIHPMGDGKQRIAERLASIYDFDLSESAAYADRLSDVPLMARVRDPVAVNPESALERYAQAHGWKIVNWHRPAS